MDTSQGESNQNDPNPMDYVTETKNFRVEALKSVEIQERHKKEALAKCSDLHNKLLDCYDKRRFCGTVEKEFWDCYRNERGFKKSKVSAWAYNFYHKNSAENKQENQ